MIKSHVMSIEAGHESSSATYEKLAPKVALYTGKNPKDALPGFAENARRFFTYEALAHGGTVQAWQLLREAAQLSAGFFQSVQCDGQPIRIRYRDSEVETVGQYTDYKSGALQWFDAIWLALMARDPHSLNLLMQADALVFENTRSGSPTVYKTCLGKFFKALITGSDELLALQTKAMNALTGEGVQPQVLEYEADILGTALAVLGPVLMEQGETEYNAVLQEAILRHQQFWQTHDPEAAQGFISFPLTAVAAIAHDRVGYRVTVESEYVLGWVAQKYEPVMS